MATNHRRMRRTRRSYVKLATSKCRPAGISLLTMQPVLPVQVVFSPRQDLPDRVMQPICNRVHLQTSEPSQLVKKYPDDSWCVVLPYGILRQTAATNVQSLQRLCFCYTCNTCTEISPCPTSLGGANYFT